MFKYMGAFLHHGVNNSK